MRVINLSCVINDSPVQVSCDSDMMLMDVLRDVLSIGKKRTGCLEGECGACTIIMDGIAVNACLVPAAKAMGKNIQTIEGMAKGGRLHPIQKAFIEKGAVICDACTSGIIMAAKALLDKDRVPDREEIRDAVGSHVCKCSDYFRIEQAIFHASKIMQQALLSEKAVDNFTRVCV